MPTLAETRTLLSRYAGANNTFVDRLNLAVQRLMQSGNWRFTKERVTFSVFLDAQNRAVITLPKKYVTILGGVYLQTCNSDGTLYGWPLATRNSWYSFTQNGPGYITDSRYNWQSGFNPEEGWFTTFRDWTTPMFLRLKFAATEANGSIFNIRGNLNGQPIYTGVAANTIQGENLTTAGATTLTTSSQFSEPPYEVSKPITYGRVSMYTWDGVTETLVATYDPTETLPKWRRYKVPGCTNWTEADPGQFLTICKRGYVPVSNDNDEVIPGNLGALRFGLDALLKEDAQDFTRAKTLWQDAKELLTNEVDDDTGAGAQGSVQVVDTFGLNEYSVGGYT